MVNRTETRIGHRLPGKHEVWLEETPLHYDKAVLRLHRGAFEHHCVLGGQRHRRLEDRPEPLLERHKGVGDVVGGARGDQDEIDVGLVEHVGKAPVHPAFREVATYQVTPLLGQIARANDLEKAWVREQDGVVILHHGPSKPHEGDLKRRSLALARRHFLTISVIAERNCATSLNWRYTLAKRM